MTINFAAPESGTLVERLERAASAIPGLDIQLTPETAQMYELFTEAATALSLAQTEIKDWKIAFDGLIAAAEVKTATINGLQARIAALEKELAELHREWEADILAATDLRQDAARYRWLRSNKRLLNITIEQFHPVRKTLCDEFADAAIDAALKSRA